MTDLARTAIRHSFHAIIAPQSARRHRRPLTFGANHHIYWGEAGVCRQLNVPVPSDSCPRPVCSSWKEIRRRPVPSTWRPAARWRARAIPSCCRSYCPTPSSTSAFPAIRAPTCPTARRSKATTASPSPAPACMSMTTRRQVTRQIELARAVLEGRHAGVRKLLGPAGAHRRRRRRRPQEPEGPRDRLRPAHQADRARPQASDVCRQARGVQRADRASRRGRDHRAGHHRARHQRGVRRPERGNPLQRRGGLGRAVSPRISAARDRRHRPADRAPPDRRRLFPRHRGDREPSPTTSSTLDRNPAEKRLSWRYGISKNVLDKKLRTGEVANWLQYQVLPTRAKRGRG